MSARINLQELGDEGRDPRLHRALRHEARDALDTVDQRDRHVAVWVRSRTLVS